MQLLTAKNYDEMKHNATVLEADSLGDKVLLLNDGTVLKLFRRKRLLSSALFFPYSRRFVQHAARLAALGISTVSIINLYDLPSISRTGVHYHPLQGEVLRQCFPRMTNEKRHGVIVMLAEFISLLHEKGIYFRSLHFGNIIYNATDALGLIDISDIKFYRKPLSLKLRLRNFGHFVRYQHDLDSFSHMDLELFMHSYSSKSHLSVLAETRLQALFL